MAKGVMRYVVVDNGSPVPEMKTIKEIREAFDKYQANGQSYFDNRKVFKVGVSGELIEMKPKFTVSLTEAVANDQEV